MMTEKYPRTKATIMASGIDPHMKRLNKVHAIRSSTKKRYIRALEAVETYWEDVFAAMDEQEEKSKSA